MLQYAMARLKHLAQMAFAGADNTTEEWEGFGPTVTLWRKRRNGEETREEMPEFLAEITLLAISEMEPDVVRAKIIR